MDDHGQNIGALAAAGLAGPPPHAAGFIVTLYGDAVVPRGGEVWIGTIIATCALVGISETLVRTAVSRLVGAGQLDGSRRGRRSFYRLTEAALAEYQAAAREIYGPPDVVGWRFVHLPESQAEAVMARLEKQGYARLRPTLAVGPARGPVPQETLVFEAQASGDRSMLADFAAQFWDLEPHATAYRDFLSRFCELPVGLIGADAMAARLLMVHQWRRALLRDPRLPPAALPGDWPGHAARALFRRLYPALLPETEGYIDAEFECGQGRLPDRTGKHYTDRIESL